MSLSLRNPVALGLTAIGLTVGLAGAAQADPFLPVQNLTFTQFNPGGTPPKAGFTAANPVGWTGGTGLIAIDAPGTATDSVNGQYGVWGPFADPPPGGNFIQADGNPIFETSFNQTITGLTPGQSYTLTFWQAAGQQNGFVGDTTEQWKVFFGNGTNTVDCSTDPCTITTTNQEVDSPLMNTPSMGTHPWELVSLSLVADATSDVLSFLAWGNGGTTVNLPPTVFLAGVNSPAVPEPATLSLLGVGLLGVGGTILRRRAKRKTAA